MESKMFHLLKEAAKSWAWIFVPHRENGDVMPRPYKYVRTIYRMYVAKLDDPCTFSLYCIVLYRNPISRKDFNDLSKGRQWPF